MNTKKSCKFAILTLISGIMSGCASNHTLIQRSEIAFENIKTNEVYFCKCGMGPVVYNVWIKEGVENGWRDEKTKVYLVDSITFYGPFLGKGGNLVALAKTSQ